MNPAVQLSLAAKAEKVFASDDTFLSFPVTPLPFTARELDFSAQGDADAVRETLANHQTFSMLVSLIPDGPSWLPTEATFLWDVYGDILGSAKLASSSRTSAEEETYQQARAFLSEVAPDGSRKDSAALAAYKRFKDAYIIAQQDYLAAKIAGEAATGEALSAWLEEAPKREKALAELSAAWVVEGHKAEVEDAQAKLIALGAKSPFQTWAQWRDQLGAEIDTIHNPADTTVTFPCYFSPANAVADGAWRPFSLTKAEVKTLLAEHPAARRDMARDDTIEALSFEFSSAVILRPWFAPELFRARFWRLPDGSSPVSEGNDTFGGACPAYVTAVVFARNVKVELSSQHAAGNASTFKGFEFATLSPKLVAQPTLLDTSSKLTASILDKNSASKARMLKRATRFGQLGAGSSMSARARVGTVVDRRLERVRFGSGQAAAPRSARITRPLAIHLNPQLLEIMNAEPTTAPPAKPEPSPEPEDTIYILAMICKKVPRCPDPDPTLPW